MRNLTLILFCLFSLSLGSLQAQVTVGSDKIPEDYSVLEIISNGTGGLRLPHLNNKQRKALTQSQAFIDEIIDKGRGLTIYNTDINCVEYWNKTKWVSQCDDPQADPCLEPCDCDGDGFLAKSCGGNDPDDDDPCNPAVRQRPGADHLQHRHQLRGILEQDKMGVAVR
ncbi:hypothetical protein D0T84_06385 [Dysgonomonas sp. 521]|nr:hypothetical protein [Dysgonomonas sp. 521]